MMWFAIETQISVQAGPCTTPKKMRLWTERFFADHDEPLAVEEFISWWVKVLEVRREAGAHGFLIRVVAVRIDVLPPSCARQQVPLSTPTFSQWMAMATCTLKGGRTGKARLAWCVLVPTCTCLRIGRCRSEPLFFSDHPRAEVWLAPDRSQFDVSVATQALASCQLSGCRRHTA